MLLLIQKHQVISQINEICLLYQFHFTVFPSALHLDAQLFDFSNLT